MPFSAVVHKKKNTKRQERIFVHCFLIVKCPSNLNYVRYLNKGNNKYSWNKNMPEVKKLG